MSYAIDAQMERLRAFVHAVGARVVHLGGSSMGGFIVTAYALAHPEEVASLWLLAPAGTAAAFDSPLGRDVGRGGDNPLLAPTPERFGRTLAFVMADPPLMPSSVRRLLAERAAADYPLHARIFEQVGPGRVETLDARLREVAAPTLVVWGTADRALSPAAAEVYRRAMPHAEVVLLDGIRHLPMVEAPERTARAYLAFRTRLDTAGAPGGGR